MRKRYMMEKEIKRTLEAGIKGDLSHDLFVPRDLERVDIVGVKEVVDYAVEGIGVKSW